jgi:uncharacterized damage-inducible protein DinB
MLDYVKQILIGQFEASLAMLNECVRMCPDEHWEDKIATVTFRQVAYHTLFFVEYLSPTETEFRLRDFHIPGGDERNPFPSPGLSRDDTLSYVSICRQKALDVLNAETEESLKGPSGFSWRTFTRGELHIYNIRHVQHHTGQLSAFLRKLGAEFQQRTALPWIATGWR